VIEALLLLNLHAVTVIGWSLGGHVGIEMVPRFPGLRGLMLIGAPPVYRGKLANGFIASPAKSIAGREHLSETEIEGFVSTIFGDRAEPFIYDAVKRADGRLRVRVFAASREGLGCDQRITLETIPVPLAIVNGAADPFVNLDYLDTLDFPQLWDQRCHRLPGLKHAPFWESAATFNPLLTRFLQETANA
jgi:pimeloyl-ACP methyl ester carboxylesterase